MRLNAFLSLTNSWNSPFPGGHLYQQNELKQTVFKTVLTMKNRCY
ncbi:MAG: hypothetical protein RLZZ316_2238 [Bacteroidota bacterium]|jgi:hypothetical protein